MLNGSHSVLAYVGLSLGLEHVHDAMEDPNTDALLRLLMRQASLSFKRADGQNLRAYASDLRARFRSTALPHRLSQIAMDGSQKIPQRWLEPAAALSRMRLPRTAMSFAFAAWIFHVARTGDALPDPMAITLNRLWTSAGADGVVEALIGEEGLFAATWRASAEDKRDVQQSLDMMMRVGTRTALRRFVAT